MGTRFLAFLTGLVLAAAARAQAGPEFQVNTTTTGNQHGTAVAATPSGSFVVVWASYSVASSNDIFFQRFDALGSKVGIETLVNTYTTLNQNQPSVASDSAGNFVVVWTDHGANDGLDFGVFGRRYDSSGSPLGGEFQVTTYTTGYQYPPAVAVTQAGKFVV